MLLQLTVEEHAYATVAAMLERRLGTVMSRLHRTRERRRTLTSPPAADAGRATLRGAT